MVSWHKPMLRIFLASLTLTALLAIIAILTRSFSDTGAQILGNSAAIAIYSLLALIAAVPQQEPRAKDLATLTVVSTLIALTLWTVNIWSGSFEEWTVRLIGISTTLALAGTHGSLMLRLFGKTVETDMVVKITLGLNAVLSAILIVLFLGDGNNMPWRFVAVLAVLAVLGTLAAPLVAALTETPSPRKRSTEPSQA
ncbi:MAG: hypothetical protein ACLGH3_07575 [Actinomycetota bacterium]